MEIAKIFEQLIDSETSAEELLADIELDARLESYQEDTYIFEQNEKVGDQLYIILEGFVELIITNELGISKSIGHRYQGEFLGEELFNQEGVYNSSALAVEDLRCLLLSRAELRLLIKKEPQFAEYLIKSLISWKDDCFQHLSTKENHREQKEEELEVFPFRKRIYQVMNSPVETCSRADSIFEVAKTMQERNISSIVVAENNRPVGIITEKELVHKLVAQKRSTNQVLVEDVMSTEVVTVAKNAFFYQALYSMVKHQLKHVVVVERNVIVGIVTVRDLAQTRNTGLVTIVNEIETQHSIEGLNKAREKVDKVLKALVVEKARAREICQLITEFNDRLTRRVIVLCEEEMKQEGYGSPPVDYCFLQMGSAGRKEQFLRTDQDNAFIYADPEQDKEEVDEYFRILGEKIVDKLIKVGFEECEGGVMVSNHYWRNSFTEWKNIINLWVSDLTFTRVRAFNIFFDFRVIYGDFYLAQRIKQYLIDVFQEDNTALFYLGKVALYNKLPLGFFGRLITEKSEENKDQINLKLGGSVQMVDCIRAFALKEGIKESSTFERIEMLAKHNVITSEEKFVDAYQQLLKLRINENLAKLEAGQEPDNYLNPKDLDKKEYQSLKEVLSTIEQLMELTGHAFKVFS